MGSALALIGLAAGMWKRLFRQPLPLRENDR